MLSVLTFASVPATAQVTVDLHALDALPGAAAPPHPEPARHPPAPKRPPHQTSASIARNPQEHVPAGAAKPPPAQTATASPAVSTPAAPGTPSGTAAPLPVPATAPPTVALAPIAPPPPTQPAVPPPPPPISASASSEAKPVTSGLTVTFGAGQADLSPESATAIQSLVKKAPSGGDTSFNVVAYAAGTPSDPSTARRLSLSRALAVRSALMSDGVSSARIFLRALGAKEGDQTPDRVDLAVLGANAPAGASSEQP